MSWYPGHMKKALDEIKEKIKLVDVVIEVIDARMPYSTKNPYVEKIAENKEHILLMTKKDLADKDETAKWLKQFREDGFSAFAINTFDKRDISSFKRFLKDVKQDILENKKSKRENFEMKVMVVGMPNVGKSSFLNAFKGTKSTKVGNTPGVTRNMQWVRTGEDILLLDTPGILMMSRSEENRVTNLEVLNSIDTSEIDAAETALLMIKILQTRYPGLLNNRYGVDESEEPLAVLEGIAKRRGALIKGGEYDYSRAGSILVDEFRKGVLGNLTLESVDEIY